MVARRDQSARPWAANPPKGDRESPDSDPIMQNNPMLPTLLARTRRTAEDFHLSRSRRPWRRCCWLIVTAIVALAGCNSNPTAEEAARKFSQAYCEKLQQCFSSSFASAYGSVDACVNKAVSAIPESKRSQEDACSDSEVDTCVKDVRAMSCASSVSAMSLPASCSKC